VAGKLAEDEEIEMNDEHWEIINFLRDYYQEFQIAPAVKVLTKAIAKKNDIHKKEASVFLYELFPNGPGLQACKIAGLPKPTGCV
jgi:tRNA 2-thiouridine synthesizing protein E